jgi:hypothetical protein
MAKNQKQKKPLEKKPQPAKELDPQHEESLARLADVSDLMSNDWSARLSYIAPRKAA